MATPKSWSFPATDCGTVNRHLHNWYSTHVLVVCLTSALDRGRVCASGRVQRVCEMDLVAITLIFVCLFVFMVLHAIS